MVNDKAKMTGKLAITLKKKDGTIKEQREENLVVTTGKEYMAACLGDDTFPGRMTHIAVGASNTSPDASQTLLLSELVSGRAVISEYEVSGQTVYFTADFDEGVGTGAITEAGIFNSGTIDEGIMLSRTTFNVVNKEADDTMTIRWAITIN